MIKIAIVDDEKEQREILCHYYQQLNQEIHEELTIQTFSSGEELLNDYDGSYDLISLDIELGGRDGVTIAKELRKSDEEVIIVFVTNMAQLAIKGYEVKALDFLVKPINYYSFALKIGNALSMIKNKKSKSLIIPTKNGIEKIASSQLYYAEIFGHELYYHTNKGVFQQRISLKSLEDSLVGLTFKRCNNSCLVNLKYVDSVRDDEIQVDGNWLKISRPRKKEFLQALANYMGGIN